MLSSTQRIVMKAPAKINLFLEVMGKRQDGYHDIRSIIVPVSLYDIVEIEKAPVGVVTDTVAGDRLIPWGRDLPGSDDNLVTKAALALKDKTGYAGGARIRITKNIPLGGGFGGGSSDAATALIGLNRLWGNGLGVEDLSSIGAKLGCDVPAFICGGPVAVSGVGEIVEPIKTLWSNNGYRTWCVLVNPGFPVSTSDIYGRYRMTLTPAGKNYTDMRLAIEELDLGRAAGIFYNSLESVVFDKYPLVALFAEKLKKAGAVVVQVSGSGGSLFGLVSSEEEACQVERRFAEAVDQPVWSSVVNLLPDGVMVAHGPLEARV